MDSDHLGWTLFITLCIMLYGFLLHHLGVIKGRKLEDAAQRDKRAKGEDREYERGYKNGKSETANRVNASMKALLSDQVVR